MMNSSFLYHAWGLYDHQCSGMENKGNTIILHIEKKNAKENMPSVRFTQFGQGQLITKIKKHERCFDKRVGQKVGTRLCTCPPTR